MNTDLVLADVDTELCLPPGILMGALFMTASVFISVLLTLSKLLVVLSTSVRVLKLYRTVFSSVHLGYCDSITEIFLGTVGTRRTPTFDQK